MLAMDKVYSIRQRYYEQGKKIANIIKETGHDRKTVVKKLQLDTVLVS